MTNNFRLGANVTLVVLKKILAPFVVTSETSCQVASLLDKPVCANPCETTPQSVLWRETGSV